jgi:LIVCS family branched-chain amino acid:cation transporter
MLVWFPIGEGPRCIQIAYEALARYVPATPLWTFASVYTLLVYYVIHHRSRILTILGYYMSPALLIFLSILWIMGLRAGEAPTEASSLSNVELFNQGLVHGYSTMDLIASFFFSSTLIHLLQRYRAPQQTTMQNALKSGIIGMGTLGIVYTALIHLAASNADKLADIPKQQILPFVSEVFLGPQWSIIPVAIIILACLTTSVAMTTAFSEFLRDKWLGEERWSAALWTSLLSTLLFSFIELQSLIEITSPVLQIACPALILLTLYHFLRPEPQS